MTRVGSLCSGYGGLEMGLAQVVDIDVAWHAENDPAAATVLAHRYPGIPNHGDLTTVDWTAVEPVDWLVAGWPCQPFSTAGKRKGAADVRAIWPNVAHAVRDLRPRYVFLENVARIITAGELARAVGSLAALGYVGSWLRLRASDVGAPHRRERCFILAADACVGELQRRGEPDQLAGPTGPGAGEGTQRQRLRDTPVNSGATAADTADFGHERAGDPRRRWHGSADGGDAAADTTGARRDGRGENPAADRRDAGTRRGSIEPQRDGDPRPAVCPTCGCPVDYHDAGGFCAGPCGGRCTDPEYGRPAAADTDSAGPQRRRVLPEGVGERPARPGRVEIPWGDYDTAVRRWEHITGRHAPHPTAPTGRDGGERLNAAFVEWMMGLPDGWVTDVPGLSRASQIKILGNGVVPQQAAVALTLLIQQTHREAM